MNKSKNRASIEHSDSKKGGVKANIEGSDKQMFALYIAPQSMDTKVKYERKHMTEKIIDEMRIPHGEEYSTAVDTNIRRYTICEFNDKEISLQRSYTVDGRQFIVNSIFDKTVKKTAADGVIRLIDIELEKVS